MSYLALDMEKSMGGNQQKWQENAPEEVGEPSKLVDKELANEEGRSHDGCGMILLPDFHMNMVLRHVVLSSKN